MKQRSLVVGFLVVVAIAMTSCFGPSNEPDFVEADLLGLWQETGTEAYVRFTAEQDETGEYKFGCEWNEAEEVYEDDLVFLGNGWFKYKLVKSDLTEIHLMDNGGASIPKVYVVQKLTDTELEYRDEFKKTYYFQKVVSVNK